MAILATKYKCPVTLLAIRGKERELIRGALTRRGVSKKQAVGAVISNRENLALSSVCQSLVAIYQPALLNLVLVRRFPHKFNQLGYFAPFQRLFQD